MFFEKFLKKYEETAVGLPRCPKRKNIDQTIYIGETDSEGYSKWKPIPYGRDESFLRLLEIYGIEKNEDIVEYFSTYYFLRIDIKFKNYFLYIFHAVRGNFNKNHTLKRHIVPVRYDLYQFPFYNALLVSHRQLI